MQCPNCNERIEYALRFLDIAQGVPHPIDKDGTMDISANPSGVANIERQHDGPAWYECPECGGPIEAHVAEDCT